ncbi:MAG: hypothetical protein ACI8UO_006183 [Verrucomicrobiales bacterium]|jgi:hypothetical protein
MSAIFTDINVGRIRYLRQKRHFGQRAFERFGRSPLSLGRDPQIKLTNRDAVGGVHWMNTDFPAAWAVATAQIALSPSRVRCARGELLVRDAVDGGHGPILPFLGSRTVFGAFLPDRESLARAFAMIMRSGDRAREWVDDFGQ